MPMQLNTVVQSCSGLLRSLTAISIAVLAYGVDAQSTPRSLLWRISHADDQDTSYLYGTVHTRDARAFQLQDSALYFFDQSDLLAGELDLDHTSKMDPHVLQAMFLPDGRSLDLLYSRGEYEEVITVLKMKLGPLAPICMKLRPYYTIAMLSEMELGSDSTMVLDAWFQARAMRMNKRIVGIESVKEQLDAVMRIPISDQSRLLLKVIRDGSFDGMARAIDAYAVRDLDAFMEFVGRDGLPEHADKALLRARNTLIAERADQFMRMYGSVFVAVGAAHLTGPHGLIEGLRRLGYIVEPVGVRRP